MQDYQINPPDILEGWPPKNYYQYLSTTDPNELADSSFQGKGNKKLLEIAIKKGATPTKAINIASQLGYFDIVRNLIEKYGVVVNDGGNNIPITVAAEHGYYDIVKYLIEKGANIHSYDDRPVKDAYKNGHKRIVALLIEHGARSPQ